MDRDLAAAILAQRDRDEEAGITREEPPLSPRGYSRDTYLRMAQVEATRVLATIVARALGDQSPPPPPFPRPVTAIQQLERDRDSQHVISVLKRVGVKGV